VELEGWTTRRSTKAQYRTLIELVPALQRAHPLRDIAAHSDIAPGRKTDPGRASTGRASRRARGLILLIFPRLRHYTGCRPLAA
jgi:AmpD protein